MKAYRIIRVCVSALLINIVIFIFHGCKKVPNGYLSDIIRYTEYPITVEKGRTKVSTPLLLEGSSQPLRVKLLHVYDQKTGALVDDLFMEEYPIKKWVGLYDPSVDTTLELIAAKQKDTVMTAITVNERSGQLEANVNTLELPVGEYLFDLEISNSTGSRVFEKIGRFDLVDAPFYEIPAVRSTVAMKVGEESTTKTLPAGTIAVERINDHENRIIVEIVDKNGVPFNPAAGEIARRPAGGNTDGWLQTMQDYSLGYESFDGRMEFAYGVVPFPLNSLGNGFNYYYRIPTQYVRFDEDLGIEDDTYSCNARFSFRVFIPGTYKITVTVLGVTRR
ncbi:DUF5007 domain-containing protein [Olivibacter sp. XZL3]|uniref:DUF5007 domain-containing protein n=1 Tax=Olivibacter sp. XZL3 TaxID=1735116 RepID=UPI001066BCA0|nr:DUF5007 domain-containing protein [Olivibacter sp. XZL3]